MAVAGDGVQDDGGAGGDSDVSEDHGAVVLVVVVPAMIMFC